MSDDKPTATITATIKRPELDELTWEEMAIIQDFGQPGVDITQRELIRALDRVATVAVDGVTLPSVGKVKRVILGDVLGAINAAVQAEINRGNSPGG